MGRESSSREAYEASEAEKNELERATRKHQDNAATRLPGDPFREHFLNKGEEFTQRATQVEKKLSGMVTAGKVEANELNREYDRLLIEANHAEQALRDFEKNKLGMSAEKEPNEEAA